MKNIQREKNCRKIKINKFYVFLVPLIAIGAVTVFLAIESATLGAKLISLEKRTIELTEENRDLAARLIGQTSLTEITQKTDELGFSKPENIVYITAETFVATNISTNE